MLDLSGYGVASTAMPRIVFQTHWRAIKKGPMDSRLALGDGRA
jgi:hypothetical protein